MKRRLYSKRQIAGFLAIVLLVSCCSVFNGQNAEAKDYSNNGCVNWVKDRVSAKLGITLPATGKNKYGLYGANNYWYTLNYSKGSEPMANSLAVWEFNNGTDGAGGKYGHVAFVESVNGDNVTVTEGGFVGSSWEGNTGVICRTQSKSAMATLGKCSGFLGYIYLKDTSPSQPSGLDPAGYIDICQSNEIGKLSIKGWTFDPDSPSTQNEVHVYIGSDDKECHNLGPANGYRQDVDDQLHCGAYHGFDQTITTNRTGNQRVRIFFINVGGGNHTLQYDNTVYIKPDTEAPTMNGCTVSDLNDKGYTITCTWNDNIGVTNVYFPTWDSQTQSGGDATWYQGTSSEAGQKVSTWKFTFSKATAGRKYFTHIYASDAAGNRTCFSLTHNTPIASPIEAKTDTTAPVFENVSLTQKEEGTVTLSVQLSDDTGLGKINNHEYLYYSMDENSGCILDFRGWISSNINCWEPSGASIPIMAKNFTAEKTTSVQCDSIVGNILLASDLSGNYAVESPPRYNDNGIISFYNIKSGDVKGEENRSIEVVLKKGEEITLGTLREKLSQLHKLDCFDAYFDAKNERILKKSSQSDSDTVNKREKEKETVLTANESGTEYVYFINFGSGDTCSCKIVVDSAVEMPGDVYQDGKIDGKDVSKLARYRLGKETFTDAQIAAADVYKDGKIDGKDVSKLARYRLGKDTLSPQKN